MRQYRNRRNYLITLTNNDQGARTRMRNALWRHGAKEIWPGFYSVNLTRAEYDRLVNRFGNFRIRNG